MSNSIRLKPGVVLAAPVHTAFTKLNNLIPQRVHVNVAHTSLGAAVPSLTYLEQCHTQQHNPLLGMAHTTENMETGKDTTIYFWKNLNCPNANLEHAELRTLLEHQHELTVTSVMTVHISRSQYGDTVNVAHAYYLHHVSLYEGIDALNAMTEYPSFAHKLVAEATQNRGQYLRQLIGSTEPSDGSTIIVKILKMNEIIPEHDLSGKDNPSVLVKYGNPWGSCEIDSDHLLFMEQVHPVLAKVLPSNFLDDNLVNSKKTSSYISKHVNAWLDDTEGRVLPLADDLNRARVISSLSNLNNCVIENLEMVQIKHDYHVMLDARDILMESFMNTSKCKATGLWVCTHCIAEFNEDRHHESDEMFRTQSGNYVHPSTVDAYYDTPVCDCGIVDGKTNEHLPMQWLPRQVNHTRTGTGRATFDFTYQVYRNSDGYAFVKFNHDKTDHGMLPIVENGIAVILPDPKDYDHPCGKCHGPAKEARCDAHKEYYKCGDANCLHTTEVN